MLWGRGVKSVMEAQGSSFPAVLIGDIAFLLAERKKSRHGPFNQMGAEANSSVLMAQIDEPPFELLCKQLKPGTLLRGLQLSYRVTFMPPAKTHVNKQERPSAKSLPLDP